MERETHGVGGSALSALVDGEEGAPVVVLLHGLLASAELWRDAAATFVEAGFRTVALDLPGHGRTLTPARADHSVGGMAELVGTWLRTTAGTAPWLVGHDVGAGVAQVVATRYPMAASHLTLVGPMVDDRLPLPFVDSLQKRAGSTMRTTVSRRRLDRWIAEGSNPGSSGGSREDADRASGGAAGSTDLPVSTVRRVFGPGSAPEDARALDRAVLALETTDTVVAAAQLSRLPMPVDLVFGATDPWTPADEVGGRLLELAPQAELAVVEDAGHWTPMERPRAFVEACLELRDRDRTRRDETEPTDEPESA